MSTQAAARRIWESVPRQDWQDALEKEPEQKTINGIVWLKWREGVGEALDISWLQRDTTIIYGGMLPERRGCNIPDHSASE